MRVKLYSGEYGEVEAELNSASILLHVQWNEDIPFTKSIYKECLEICNDILQGIRSTGFEEVLSIIPVNEPKTIKWQKMFGLTPMLETREYIIFRRRLDG